MTKEMKIKKRKETTNEFDNELLLDAFRATFNALMDSEVFSEAWEIHAEMLQYIKTEILNRMEYGTGR